MTSGYGVMFPGQGSQRPGMGKDFAEHFPEARRVFAQANEALGFDITAICHTEDERQNLTEFTQPAILTTEIAMLTALRHCYDLVPVAFAGHSLGEYSGLVAADAIPFDVAIKLVHLRGRLMQDAVPAGVGGMVALALPSDGEWDLPVQRIRELSQHHGVGIANENSPKQMVLSGEKTGLERATTAIIADYGQSPNGVAIRPTWLSVSAPFHSQCMQVIETEFRAALEAQRHHFKPQQASKVTSNLSGEFYQGSLEDLIDGLTRQISHPVRWVDNMRALRDRASPLIEVGPNRPLRKFFKVLGTSVAAIIDVRSAKRVLGAKAPIKEENISHA